MAGQGQALGTRHGPLKYIIYNHLSLAMLTYEINKYLIQLLPESAQGLKGLYFQWAIMLFAKSLSSYKT